MRTGIYIHFPFCLKKCLYCDFNSAADAGVPHEEYVAALLAEMELRQNALPEPATAPTLYFGGGTPSLMTPQQVGRLIDAAAGRFGMEPDAEVTLEANPGTLTPEKLSAYRLAGVNRLSIGIQSFEDRLLQRLGRIHTASEAVASFDAARRAAFDNISIDLMHSLPEQTLDDWREALRRAISLSPEHISAYALSVEAGTPFAGLHEAGKLPLPREEAAARMFEETIEFLGGAGYGHYEISNFARPGRVSRHNSAYWSRENYLGFGAGAHSLFTHPPAPSPHGSEGARGEADVFAMADSGDLSSIVGRRWRNACGIKEYMAAVLAGAVPEEDEELLSVEDAVSESFFLGLRMLDGLDLARLELIYGKKPLERHLTELSRLQEGGLLLREGSRVRLAPSAVILANTVFSRFL